MNLTFTQIKKALTTKETSCKDIVKRYLTRIEENQNWNIFLEVYEKEALDKALLIDEKISQGTAGKLAGMVIGIKDNICHTKHKVSAASKMLEGFTSLFSATIIERLEAEDAIFIGRLNCDEFAMGGSNENSAFGKVLNPLDITRVPGGSSGGSAAAVAGDLCTVALGSDTGGSIRQPSSFCGTVGIKPTYGRVSRHGLIAFASSFDQIGPIANDVYDAALVLEVIAGADDYDTTCSNLAVDINANELVPSSSKKHKIAYFSECLNAYGLDAEIKASIQKTITQLKEAGHTVEEVPFSLLKYMIPAYYVLTTAEASSNLSRYDGVHYGYRSKDVTDLESVYKKSRSEGFGKEVKRRIMLGTFVLSTGYYDAYYAKAQKVRRLIYDKTIEVFQNYDFIILPTTPSTAFTIGAKTTDALTMYLEDIFTVHANLVGNPAISLPIGKHSNGMPFGIQLMANNFQEQALLQFSQQILNLQ